MTVLGESKQLRAPSAGWERMRDLKVKKARLEADGERRRLEGGVGSRPPGAPGARAAVGAPLRPRGGHRDRERLVERGLVPLLELGEGAPCGHHFRAAAHRLDGAPPDRK